MEYWDLYDRNKNLLNKVHLRGEKLNSGEYHIIVFGWIVNDDHKFLLTQRHPDLKFPLTWECSKGGLLAGEDSITGAIREVEEEIGIKLNKENGQLINTDIDDEYNCIKDIYLFKKNIDINDIKVHEKEVVDVKWVSIQEFYEMAGRGEIGPSALHGMEKIKENINKSN
jgi:8-oxo-dGTP pyrophosphatase MutT (NUDIX family)